MTQRRNPADNHVEMTLDEVDERFVGEWVLMKIMALDENHEVSHGQLLAHSKSRKRINNALAKEPRPSELPPGVPKSRYSIFYAGPRVRTREEWSALLDRVAQMDPKDIPHVW